MTLSNTIRFGRFRRLYKSFATGARINSVSPDAALLYVLLMLEADDCGNGIADPFLVRTSAAPRRKEWDDAKVAALLLELTSAMNDKGRGLLRFYTVAGESYWHLIDFIDRQMGGPNGKRARRWPPCPNEADIGPLEAFTEEAPASVRDEQPSPTGPPEEPGFIQFWHAWPAHKRKTGRGNCATLWRAKKFELERVRILAGLEEWKASDSWKESEGKWIPMPYTWLGRRSWGGILEEKAEKEAAGRDAMQETEITEEQAGAMLDAAYRNDATPEAPPA